MQQGRQDRHPPAAGPFVDREGQAEVDRFDDRAAEQAGEFLFHLRPRELDRQLRGVGVPPGQLGMPVGAENGGHLRGRDRLLVPALGGDGPAEHDVDVIGRQVAGVNAGCCPEADVADGGQRQVDRREPGVTHVRVAVQGFDPGRVEVAVQGVAEEPEVGRGDLIGRVEEGIAGQNHWFYGMDDAPVLPCSSGTSFAASGESVAWLKSSPRRESGGCVRLPVCVKWLRPCANRLGAGSGRA